MTTVVTRGAGSAQALGYAARATAANYIEDVFSTYLYTGTGASQTINNGVDLATKGGLVWVKSRTNNESNTLQDTVRGTSSVLISDGTYASLPFTTNITAFNSNGFSIGTGSGTSTNGQNYASWTFRKQAKFFDVVTYTGNGVSGRTISHNLGSAPGCLIVKCTSNADNWYTKHRSLAANDVILLDSTAAAYSDTNTFGTGFTFNATNFQVGNLGANESGRTYVAYLFAHDAGGFGLTGTDNVISCGSYTGTGGSVSVNLGWEPQWILVKKSSSAGAVPDWHIYDNMRGIPTGGIDSYLRANLADAEVVVVNNVDLTSTGFMANANISSSSETYIYIAIRRGPMKVPTVGTTVFGLNARTGTGANATVTGGQTDDAVLVKNRGSAVASLFSSRLTGAQYLVTSSTAAEVAAGTTILQANPWDVMDGVKVGTTSTITNASANTFINYLLRRAPGFFDVVCYTGTGSATTVAHNLGAVPELMLVKGRAGTGSTAAFQVYYGDPTKRLVLNTTGAPITDSTVWNNTAPTATVFSLGTDSAVNGSTGTKIAYLFATVAGVSKVGSYTGNGTTQTIDCGFGAGGARFVLIKRTDAVGDWYVWDSARGIVAGNDPYLLLNSTAAEVTNTDYVDTYSAGFEISSTAPAAINANGGTFIFLAIA